MRGAPLVPVSQIAVMAAVVATLLYVPIGIALAVVLAVFGIPVDALATFGGALGTFSGLAVWWLIAFAAACVYAASVFPWRDPVPGGPGKR